MRRKLIIVGLVLAVGAVGGTLARAISLSEDAIGEWAWTTDVPGQPVQAQGIVTVAARREGIDAQTLREVVGGRSRRGSLSVLAAKNGAGTVCLAYTKDGGALMSEFRCLSGEEASKPVIFFAGNGGPTPNVVGWASIAGVARNDVGRIALRLGDGTERDLALNSWRGFSYYADTAAATPNTLLAYRANGSAIAALDLGGLSLPLDGQP